MVDAEWAVVSVHHVIPVADDREHDLSRECWCLPKFEDAENGQVVIHAALDERVSGDVHRITKEATSQ